MWQINYVFTSAEREVKESRRSGMSQSCFFGNRIGHAKSAGFGFNSRDHFDFLDLFFNLLEEERSIILAFPGFEPTHLCDPSDQKSWGISRLHHCDRRLFGIWKIAMKLYTSFGTRLGAQVRDVSAISNHEMRPESWDHFEFSLKFTRAINRITWPRRDNKFFFECWKISRVSAPFELFCDEFKFTKCCTKTFCLCWVLRGKIAVMRCVTFSNVLYVFGSFMNN